MNIFRTTKQSFFCFDDEASGTGNGSAGGTVAQPSPSSSAPATTPAAPASPGPASTPAPGSDSNAAASSDPFSGLDGNFDNDDLDQVILDEPGTVPGSPAPAAAPAAAPATPAAPTATAAEPPAAAPAPAAPAPTPTSPASSRAELDTAVEGFKANQKDLAVWAGQNLFALSDEDAAALTTDATSVIPRLMGQVYTQALAAAGNLIRNFTPAMIEQAIEQSHSTRTRATEAVSEFYKTNSDLNEKEHGELVSQWAKAFRQANPKATRAQAIDYVARAVRIQVGLPMPQAAAAPTATVRPATPFSPARPGGRAPTSAVEVDPYAGLGMDFDEG